LPGDFKKMINIMVQAAKANGAGGDGWLAGE
jgi:hypothetical protein